MARLLVEGGFNAAQLRKPAFARVRDEPVPLDLEGGQRVTFVAQFRRCRKPSCSECPHGPYAFVVIGSSSSKRRIYLGRLPEGSPLAPAAPAPRRKRR